ncbi:MAG: minor capsid protein [Eubacteriales bacterium]|nr:minor capsid protein [Eubacteriales bacterium]
MTKNEEYWALRAAQRMFERAESAEVAADAIAKMYMKSSAYLTFEAEKIFTKFQEKFGLTEGEARRLLSQMGDRTSFDELIQKLQYSSIEEKKILKQQYEAPAYAVRVRRLHELQEQLNQLMKDVYQQELEYSTDYYTELAEQAYYETMFDLQKRVGMAFSFTNLDKAAIEEMLHSKWSGQNYSERIWKNTRNLAQTLKEELLVNLVTGRTEHETAQMIAKNFAQGASNARRLIRTESCFVSGQIEMKAYEEAGVEEYLYVATLDLRTSEICRELDGKRFKVSEQKPGTNCPPMHPWCRSTTIADVSPETLATMQRRARDPETGKTYLVPADMTYQEWYKGRVGEKYKFITAGAAFVNQKERLYRYAKKIKPFQDFEDVVCHATPDHFLVDLVGEGRDDDFISIKPEEFAERIKNSRSYHGGKIRLISCQAGAKEDGAARKVADILNVKVLAPTEVVNVNEEGEIFVSDSDVLAEMWYNGEKVSETGEWKLFIPKRGSV